MCPFELRATPMPSPRYRLGGMVRKFGTDSYGISGAVAYAVARGGTCWADVGTARITLARAKANPMKRFIAASVKFRGGSVTLLGCWVDWVIWVARSPSYLKD